MGKSSDPSATPSPSPSPSPESFSFYLLQGESLLYPRGTITPTKCAYSVDLKPLELNATILRSWFMQSVVPLVGNAAADSLKKIFDSQRELATEFFNQALKFRQGLK